MAMVTELEIKLVRTAVLEDREHGFRQPGSQANVPIGQRAAQIEDGAHENIGGPGYRLQGVLIVNDRLTIDLQEVHY